MIQKIILVIFYLGSLYFGLPHDAPIAMFKLHDQPSSTDIHIAIDAEDFSTTVGIPQDQIDLDYLKDYMKEHLKIQFDQEVIDFHLTESFRKMDHLHITGSIDTPLSTTLQVQVFNTCLLDIEDQSNIIQLKYAEQLRDFRMSKDRKVIDIAL